MKKKAVQPFCELINVRGRFSYNWYILAFQTGLLTPTYKLKLCQKQEIYRHT